MSKFNERKTVRTVNKSGYAAYKMTDKEKLVTQVLTSFFCEPKFYGDNSGDILHGLAAVCDSDPAFVAKLGLFARSEFNMRSISHVVGAVLANRQAGKPYTRAAK